MKQVIHTDAEREEALQYYKAGLSLAVISRKMRIDRTVLVRWLGLSSTPEETVDEVLGREGKTTGGYSGGGKLRVLRDWQGVVDQYKRVKDAVRMGNRKGIAVCLGRLSKQCLRMKERVSSGYSKEV